MAAAAIALLSPGARTYGQLTSPKLDYDPTPKALEMTRYGNLPIDQNSGRVTFEIPVYTYEDQDFKIPVSLSYASSGFRPGTQTGEAGLGWTLMAGGSITREIIGGDDFGESGAFTGTHTTDAQTMYTMGYQVHYPCITEELLQPYVTDFKETTSDIYHFSFAGQGGSFIVGNDHQFHPYGTTDGLGTYSIDYQSGAFTIITGDGYTYKFGSTDQSRELVVSSDPLPVNSPRQLRAREKAVVTWLLDRIEAPDGRFVEFTYSSIGASSPVNLPDQATHHDIVTSIAPCLPRQITPDNFPQGMENQVTVYKSASIKYTSYLTDIHVYENRSNSQMVAHFVWNYETGNEMGSENNTMYTKLAVPTRKLSSISFIDDGRILREATLEYTYDGCRPLLESVELSGIGEYEMSYFSDSAHPLPGLTTNAVDYWGFYNGQDDNSDQILVGLTSVSSNYDETIPSNHTYMDPNWQYSRLGTLSKVTYPTGGSTTVAVEANQATKILLRRRATSQGITPADPYVHLIGDDTVSDSFTTGIYPVSQMLHSQECGGVRVASLTDNDAVGGTSTRTFQYNAGLVQLFPRYYVGSIVSGSPILVSIPSLSFPASCLDKLHVSYGSVRETMPDGSSTLSEFSSWQDFPDTYSTNRTNVTGVSSTGDDAYDLFLDNRLREPDSRHYRRGLLKSQKKYAPDNFLLEERTLDYQDIGDGYASYIVGSGRYWWSARRFICDRRVTSETVRENFRGASSLTTHRNYSYDSRGRKVSETVTFPDGESRTTGYTYTDHGHRHDLISQQSVSGKRSFEQSERLLEKATFTYSHPSGNMWNLTGYNHYLYDSEDSQGTVDAVSFSNFDQYGNPWQQTVNGVNTAIVWGYRGRYQVARVTGCTYSSLPGVVKTTVTAGLSSSQIQALRSLSGAETTTYEYIPSVGASEITGPSGRPMRYTYDMHGRLSKIYGSDSLMVQYTYGYQIKGGYSLKYVQSETFGQPGITEKVIYDGLGRQWLTSSGGTPSKMISLKYYDNCGVESRKYLPYSGTSVSVQSPLSVQREWWDLEAGEGEGDYAFEQSGYDNCLSPRSTWTRMPGSEMAGDSHRQQTVVTSNGSNEMADLRFDGSDGTVTVAGTVPAGKMRKTVTTSPDGHIAITFADGSGRTVLERRMDGNDENDTYYVYDSHGRTAWVITPELAAEVTSRARSGQPSTWSAEDSAVADACYVYTYDSKGDLSSSSIPGAGKSTSYYDSRHLLSDSEPSLYWNTMLSQSFGHDNSGRVTSASLKKTNPVEINPGEPTFPPLLMASPHTGTWPLSTYSYEDGDLVLEKHHVVDTTFLKYPLRAATFGNYSIVDDPVSSLYSEKHYEYDDLGRMVKTVVDWPDGGQSKVDRTYDLRGKVLSETEKYARAGAAPSDTLWLSRSNTYDAFGHCIASQTRIGRGSVSSGDSEITYSSSMTYDSIGRLVRKTVTDGSGTVRDDFSYTMQGWMDNTSSKIGNNLIFNEELKYWNPEKSQSVPRYDGTISEATVSRAAGNPRTEGYSYDALGRITGTKSYSGATDFPSTACVEDNIGYDRMGNILSLKRYGLEGLSENLGFTYHGNQLASVRDTVSSSTFGYTYNAAGNMVSDGSTGLEYRYNAIGRMSEAGVFHFSNLNELAVKYIYLADGTKIEARKGDGSATLYRGTFILHSDADGNESLESILLPESLVASVGDSLKMFTFVRGHLGSVRAVVDLDGQAVCEESDYYTYGGNIPGCSATQLFDSRWGYSGKEDQSTIAGLPYLDYGARLYDTRTCRWLSPDPLAEKYYSLSPYAYCAGDPVNFVDPDGNNPWLFLLLKYIYEYMLISKVLEYGQFKTTT